MKKTIRGLLALVLALALALPGTAALAVETHTVLTLEASATTRKVTFSGTVSDDVLAVAVQVLDSDGELVAMQTTGVNVNHEFSDTIDVSLTAGEYTVRAADYDGGAWKTVDVTVKSGGGYVAPDEEEEEEPARPFTDVANPKAWYYDAVYYGYDKGYFAGVSTTEFAPTTTMTRAMFATVLYSMAGKPEVAATASFPDVVAGKWYTNGVLWGAAQGIISGYPDGTFGTTDPVTREQMAVLLWNYAGKPMATADLSKFSDADQISTYAKAAMNWAVSAGVLNGKDGGRLDPKASATRAEVAQIVMNFDTKTANQ